MLTSLFVKASTGLAALVQLVVAAIAALRPSREFALARPRLARGAEFIEVALYAAIIVTIAWIFREQLRDAFSGILDQIRQALGVDRTS